MQALIVWHGAMGMWFEGRCSEVSKDHNEIFALAL